MGPNLRLSGDRARYRLLQQTRAMVFYAHSPARRSRQILVDLLVVAWVYVAVRAGQAVHEATLRLAAPGRALEQAGRDVSDNLHSAAEKLGELPFVGSDVRGPLDDAANSTQQLISAGQDLQTSVGRLAVLLGVLVAAIPILLVLLAWLPARLRFARRAGAAQRFVDDGADLDLFALRAMANQPMHVLAKVSDDPVGAWRRGDPAVVRALAVLELRSVGLRPPP